MKKLYTARATTLAGRDGHTATDDKKINFDLSVPGSGGTGTNPEQLFACAYSACFGSAVAVIAKKDEVDVKKITIDADVHLHQDEKGGFFISVALNATLDGVDQETARHLVQKAHHVCPYSKATRGNIEVELKVNSQSIGVQAA